MNNYVIVGAGITGATIARLLANRGKKITVLEKENHVGGACYDIIQHGIPVCQHGGHIFHTNEKMVWDFINNFSEFYPYEHRVLAYRAGTLYPMPINLLTLSLEGFQTSRQAREYFANLPFVGNANFEEIAISTIGIDLYKKFFYGYTWKQWGIDPKNLPVYIFGRLPVRFNADTRYFSDRYQGMPTKGYTHIIENMLDHKNISVKLKTPYEYSDQTVIYTGSRDEYYKYQCGQLGYRSISHDWIIENEDNYGAATINYSSLDEKPTRTITFNHFYPHIKAEKFITAIEYSNLYDEKGGHRLYPIPTEENLMMYTRYKAIQSNAIFAGRLGGYKYINMDTAIRNAIDLARNLS